jgi:large subunit ribosomal protein L5
VRNTVSAKNAAQWYDGPLYFQYMSLQTTYQNEIKPKLQSELAIKNVQAVPKLVKIVVNVGLGEALADKKVMDKVADQLKVITGQKPARMRARVSISTFKLRAGEEIGLKVTLRAKRMYDFFERLVNVVLPRTRDFRGVPRSGFDKSGNYNLGLREQVIFPELEYSMIDKARGLQITFVTNAGSKEAGFKLFEKMGMPFAKEEVKNTN